MTREEGDHPFTFNQAGFIAKVEPVMRSEKVLVNTIVHQSLIGIDILCSANIASSHTSILATVPH